MEFTLSDVLDRILDKGLVINADIIISVAGIPLVGISLRAAVAGMETMLSYGMMREWDLFARMQASSTSPSASGAKMSRQVNAGLRNHL